MAIIFYGAPIYDDDTDAKKAIVQEYIKYYQKLPQYENKFDERVENKGDQGIIVHQTPIKVKREPLPTDKQELESDAWLWFVEKSPELLKQKNLKDVCVILFSWEDCPQFALAIRDSSTQSPDGVCLLDIPKTNSSWGKRIKGTYEALGIPSDILPEIGWYLADRVAD